MFAERKLTETARFMEQNFPFKANTRSAGVYISKFMEL
jgi:hypothetical protein